MDYKRMWFELLNDTANRFGNPNGTIREEVFKEVLNNMIRIELNEYEDECKEAHRCGKTEFCNL